jgi:hypothetical protein
LLFRAKPSVSNIVLPYLNRLHPEKTCHRGNNQDHDQSRNGRTIGRQNLHRSLSFRGHGVFLSDAPDHWAGVEQQSTEKVREHYESPSTDEEVVLLWSPAPVAEDAGPMSVHG